MTALTTIPTAVATLATGRAIDRFGRKRSSVAPTAGARWGGRVRAGQRGRGPRHRGADRPGTFAELFVSPSTTAPGALMGEVSQAGGIGLERLAGVGQLRFSVAYVVGPAITGVLLAATTPIVVSGPSGRPGRPPPC